ncbi:MAG TPA: hypothetical protein VMS17_20895 [Gemmataceae bacterium]|nr:hypothetical protein [Gemmataceae bacterium]
MLLAARRLAARPPSVYNIGAARFCAIAPAGLFAAGSSHGIAAVGASSARSPHSAGEQPVAD